MIVAGFTESWEPKKPSTRIWRAGPTPTNNKKKDFVNALWSICEVFVNSQSRCEADVKLLWRLCEHFVKLLCHKFHCEFTNYCCEFINFDVNSQISMWIHKFQCEFTNLVMNSQILVWIHKFCCEFINLGVNSQIFKVCDDDVNQKWLT